MAHYILLINWTDAGVRSIKDTIKRADGFREMAKAAGATVKDIYWTQGSYDLVATVEAKDEISFMALTASVAKGGNIRTHTLRAFTQAEASQIMAKVT